LKNRLLHNLSAMSSYKTMSSSNPSLCIPRVFPNITEQRVRDTFDALGLGNIKRIDMVPRTSDSGDKFQRVFIHFDRWYDNETAQRAMTRVLDGKEIKIIYDEPWFWKASMNRSEPRRQDAMPTPRICLDEPRDLRREPRRDEPHDLRREPRRDEPRDLRREPRRDEPRDLRREPRRDEPRDLRREPRRDESRGYYGPKNDQRPHRPREFSGKREDVPRKLSLHIPQHEPSSPQCPPPPRSSDIPPPRSPDIPPPNSPDFPPPRSP
jgi:hypothetical protein